MSIDVNKAWNKLHTRLEDEDLLASGKTKTGRISAIAKLRWAAGIAFLICCSAGIYFFSGNEAPSFVINNPDTDHSLVSTLEDGSTVYLTGGATLTCPEHFAGNERKVSLQGEALFDVRSNPDNPFIVETESVVIEVVGTAFSVKSSDKDAFELLVRTGKVKAVVKGTNIPVFIETNESVYLKDNQLHKTYAENDSYFARYTDKIHFNGESLGNIVEVISKFSGKPIVFSDNSIAGKNLTITFHENTPEEMLELVCITFGLKYTDESDRIVIGR